MGTIVVFSFPKVGIDMLGESSRPQAFLDRELNEEMALKAPSGKIAAAESVSTQCGR